MVLTARILDRDRSVLAVLPEAFAPRYSRRPRSATEVVVSVPRTAPGLEHAVRSNILEIWRGETQEASGRLELRDVAGGVVTLTAYTEEILLKDYRTPAAYGAALSGLDAADVVRSCLNAWTTQRVKSTADWNGDNVPSQYRSNVQAIDAAGGSLWLTRNGSGQYERAGHAVFTFEGSQIPGFVGWDRIRWSSDWPPDGLVYTTVQYYLNNSSNAPGPQSSSWLPNISFPSDSDNSQTLRGERGVLPDELGIDLGGDPRLRLHVICRLYTDDQVSQEEGETGTSGSSPRFFALEAIARVNTPLTAGEIPAATGKTIQAVNADAVTAFDLVRDACEQAGLDFQVRQGQLHVAEAFGPSLTAAVNLVTSEGTAALDAPSEYVIVTYNGQPVLYNGEFLTYRVET